MKKISLFISVLAVLAISSCTKDPEALEFPDECFPQAHEFTFDVGSAFTSRFSQQQNFYPNCITPDGDETNDTLIIHLSKSEKYDWRKMVVYDEKKNIVAQFKGRKSWDGKLADGSVQNGIYGFKIEVIYSPEERFNAYGMVCVRECFESGDDIESAVFGDQLHPTVGDVYDTRQEINYCN
ncbi:MAG: gliding motility-associated C-terminal domain-containing protein [Bacteroidia bacterium]